MRNLILIALIPIQFACEAGVMNSASDISIVVLGIVQEGSEANFSVEIDGRKERRLNLSVVGEYPMNEVQGDGFMDDPVYDSLLFGYKIIPVSEGVSITVTNTSSSRKSPIAELEGEYPYLMVEVGKVVGSGRKISTEDGNRVGIGPGESVTF